jgi:hypothetical protein
MLASSAIDANGNPIIVSGNHNRTVAESVYPASRIHAYVLPGADPVFTEASKKRRSM